MDEIIKVTCQIEKIRYYKNDWGIVYTSITNIKEGEPKTDDNNYLVLKGNMVHPVIGNKYDVTAEYDKDDKWGEQYKIISFCSAIKFGENDPKGQKQFLLSLFTQLQVESMYEALDDPFDVLKRKAATELVNVKGCGMKTAVKWIDRFAKNYHLGKIYSELGQYNLTNTMISKLIEKYQLPEIIVDKVKNDPYVLCDEVDGIGWKTADSIALKGGLSKFDTERISSFIVFYLRHNAQDGYSWISTDELLGAIIENIGEEVPDQNITDAIHRLDGLGKLWYNKEKTKIGLQEYYEVACNIAKELIRIKNAKSNICYSNVENTIKELENRQGWEFTDEQKDGVKTALDNNVILIQGLAGCGKTTLVNAILENLKGYSFVQCSLSGRAAARMAEVTGEDGYTIHRLLGYQPQGTFKYNNKNPLPYSIYILDEVSMVDAFLFYNLLRAIPDGAKLICLGDQGQLESIGCGNIAHDMSVSQEIPTVTLTKIHRQAASSAIITESVKIRKGEQIIEKNWAGTEIRGKLKDLVITGYSDASNTYYEIIQNFSFLMSKPDFDILKTQILVPVKNRGAACTYEINNTIQELFNPKLKDTYEITCSGMGNPYVLRVGDKVINTKNTYKTEPPIFNGNIGVIKKFDTVYKEDKDGNKEKKEVMVIDFTGIGEVEVSEEYWDNIELGYAITVHKSQGSQWNDVIFGIDYTSSNLLTRELLYTGMTRAKKKCYLITQTSALRTATFKEAVNRKQTHLIQCLHNEMSF